jgi:predicted transcriptional regulator
LDEDTVKRLEALAEATDRSKSYLVAEAVKVYLDEHCWQVEAIREGLAEAEAGKFADPLEVEEFFASKGRDAD